ncbi:hypothetical protein [Pelomicrobium sp.]|uniref:hypothetical protein n=1 Tax=Pelomicrobium sp. TaxID=2815319 RepID=UPI002FDDB598
MGSFAVAVREGRHRLAGHGPAASISQAPGERPLVRWGADGRVVLQGRQSGAPTEAPLNPG